MASLERYFSDSPILGDSAVLVGPEAHHLVHVMRAKPGTQVTLFDGTGFEFVARVERIGRSEVPLTVLSRQAVDRELPYRLTLAVSLPKGDRQKWLVEKVVELGVTRLVPLKTNRSVAQPVEHARTRLRRSVIEASKQCGRNRLMEIAEPAGWADFVAATREIPLRLLAHPGGGSGVPADVPSPMGAGATALAPVCLAIGPEGGFTDEEVAAATEAGWRRVDLGRRILRVETAAVCLVARVAQ